MANWTAEELEKIGSTDELEIIPMRKDGTFKDPVTIWVVRVDDSLYVRSVRGRASGWFKGVLARHEGRIESGAVRKDVTFVEATDPALQARISEVYRSKYKRYSRSDVNSCLTPDALSATVRLEPK